MKSSEHAHTRSADAGAPSAELSAVKRALLEIRELRGRLADYERAAREPIAIVGLSIRTAGGVHDAESYAGLLWGGRDAITEIPPDRWSLQQWFDENSEAPGKMTTRFGSFLSDIDQFDAEFFGISPAEAASLDPQQRLLLELAWEALENAGHAPTSLSETRTGIYLGISNGDYGRALFSRPELIDPYFSPGTAFSVASGRIAYFLGTRGPAVSVDTACSSSLVALHLACQGLRHGDCDVALVGGVNLILTPELNVNFSKAGMMARDGRCKTFDAAADGYVRGEGGGVVVLRRLSDALADRDRILALVRGTAINQDGKTNGLTAPNGPAQEAVVRTALESAGVNGASIAYVETHGTGTSLGDPIEVNALAAVLGPGRDARHPLVLGSVKTNIGHLEAAAGIVGLIKTVLALQRRQIPPHLNLRTPNPFIHWDAAPIEVASAVREWQPIDGRRLAGVSSFGFSGTNAHAILEEAPPASGSEVQDPAPAPYILTVSAREPVSLEELAQRYRRALQSPGALQSELADFCFTANVGRTHFPLRAAVRGGTATELVAGLDALIAHQDHPGLVRRPKAHGVPRVAFLFAGQGPQYLDMGRALYDSAPAFRAAFDDCAKVLDPLLSQPLKSAVFAARGAKEVLSEAAFAQPAMFAIECALAALWRSWGVEPVAVMGHSFGEYAAAHVAGVLSLADAARMVATRGRLVQALPAKGSMVVLQASEAEVVAALEGHAADLAIAAINGPRNTVISGAEMAVRRVAAEFAARGTRVKALRVSHAFHSPLIEPVLDDFERGIREIQYGESRVALISSMLGRRVERAQVGSARYWRDHMRRPVRFADSVRALAAEGVSHYIEISPHPVLLSMASDCIEGGTWLPSMREGEDAWALMLQGVQTLYCDGADLRWNSIAGARGARRIALPTYPFRRRRHWIDVSVGAQTHAATAAERWSSLLDTMDRQSERGPLELNAPSYPRKWDCLARLTTAHAAKVLRDCALFTEPGARYTVEQILERSGIAGTYRHLIHRWLESLAEQGALRRDGTAYVSKLPLAEPDLAALWLEADHAFADNVPLLDYVKNCARLLGPVLKGAESPLETLFPGGSFELARALYERSTVMRYINGLAAAAFERVTADLPAARVLRVLEVGAGTGGTSAALLPVLDPARTDYLYSDVSEVFLAEARARFARYSFARFGLFDLEKSPLEQGYAAGSFDVIVSANCVHAVKDLRAALERLQSLLNAGGLLILIESTQHLSYFDMTTGLIEGWQHFADDLRTDNPLLHATRWLGALRAAGFEEARAWPGEGSGAEALAQHVIIARKPGELIAGSAAEAVGQQSDRTQSAMPASELPTDLWLERLAGATQAERGDVLAELVRTEVVRVLRLDPSNAPGRHDRLMDLGMDSLMAVQLRNGLNRALRLKRSLSSTLMFDYPTIHAIAAHLDERLRAETDVDARMERAAARPVSPAPGTHEPQVEIRASEVAAMSDEQIEALLLKRLGST